MRPTSSTPVTAGSAAARTRRLRRGWPHGVLGLLLLGLCGAAQATEVASWMVATAAALPLAAAVVLAIVVGCVVVVLCLGRSGRS